MFCSRAATATNARLYATAGTLSFTLPFARVSVISTAILFTRRISLSLSLSLCICPILSPAVGCEKVVFIQTVLVEEIFVPLALPRPLSGVRRQSLRQRDPGVYIMSTQTLFREP